MTTQTQKLQSAYNEDTLETSWGMIAAFVIAIGIITASLYFVVPMARTYGYQFNSNTTTAVPVETESQ